MIKERDRIVKRLEKTKPIAMTPEDQKNFDEATYCHICHEMMGDDRVRDHDHVSGKYRGAAHGQCNLQFRLRKDLQGKRDSFYIPVSFYNLRGYDSHILMQSIGKYKDINLQVIPNIMEKYIAFFLGNLKFIDSYQFMGASLQKLVNNVAAEGKDKFQNMTAHVQNSEQQDWLLRKGVYSYDYVDEPSKFAETKLPQQEDFYSQLQEEGISDKDYAHAQKVWDVFHCKTFGEYHDLYLKTDVLLLADVLRISKMFVSPHMSWIQLITTQRQDCHGMLCCNTRRCSAGIDWWHQHVPNDGEIIRGGISVITHKHAKANNCYVPGYDASKPSNYQMYFDANNLYGWAISQSLPECGFAWVDEPEYVDYMNVSEDAETGYIL